MGCVCVCVCYILTCAVRGDRQTLATLKLQLGKHQQVMLMAMASLGLWMAMASLGLCPGPSPSAPLGFDLGSRFLLYSALKISLLFPVIPPLSLYLSCLHTAGSSMLPAASWLSATLLSCSVLWRVQQAGSRRSGALPLFSSSLSYEEVTFI